MLLALTILLCSGRPLLHLPRRWARQPRCCDTCPDGLLRWSAPRLLQRRGLQLLHQRLHVSDVWSVIHHLWLLQLLQFLPTCPEIVEDNISLPAYSPLSEQSGTSFPHMLGPVLIGPCAAFDFRSFGSAVTKAAGDFVTYS